MDIKKKLEEIEEHFNNISDEEFEKNLIKAGFNEIEPSNAHSTDFMPMNEIEKLMAEGWNIHIECKGKGRTYEMSYEATMTHVDADITERFYTKHHAVGNTLDELATNLRKTI